MKLISLARLILFFIPALIFGSASGQLKYPVTKKIDHVDDYFGTKVSDPYQWLENDTAVATKNWARQEQDFTESYLSKIPYRNAIKKRLQEVNNYERYSGGLQVGEYIIFAKNTGLQNQFVFYKQKGLTGEPHVFIDPNTMSKNGTVSVVLDAASYDHKYISYRVNKNGSDWSTAYVMEVATNKLLPDSISWMRGDALSWVKDGFYYDRYPEPAKGMALTAVPNHPKIYFHKMGETQHQDRLIYEDQANPELGIYPQTTEDGKFLFIYKMPGVVGNDLLAKRLDITDSPVKLLYKGYDHSYTVLDNIGDELYINTNEDAGNFKVVKVNFDHTNKSSWKTVIPEQKEKLESVTMAGGKLVAAYLKDALSRVYQYNTDGKLAFEVKLPGIGTTRGFGGNRDDQFLFYNFSSFNYAPSILRYDLQTGKSTLFKQSVSAIKLNDYETEQVFYTSKDGTRIPMFLVHKKGMKKDETHPTLLYAYGGFDISITPGFSPNIFIFLENNGIYAVANIRGGGEYGETWHQAGMLEKKQNVFDDFIAAGEYLIKNKYTTRKRLAVLGGSNGGLLIGAMITQRPDLFKVAIPEVGVMDMLRFQKFTSGIYWVSEFGSSDTASNFPVLYKYSPLHHVGTNIKYPATLILTADHDDRVVPMHSYKFAATLQEKQAGNDPVLIRISIDQGHGASGSSLVKDIEMATDIFSFLFYNIGITPVFK